MRPLEGLRVVDLTRVLSGPYCTMQLGDLGAEVIKVERPGEGDDTRSFAPPFQGDQAAYFLSVNRNKKSMTLDMKSPRGKEVLWRLIDVSDVLVENFRPGAMDRLGLGYAAVRARPTRLEWPSAIWCLASTHRREFWPHSMPVKPPGLVSTCAFPCTRRSLRSSPSMPASFLRPASLRADAATSIRPSSPTRPSRRPTAGSIWASPTTICGSGSAGRRSVRSSRATPASPRPPIACAIAMRWCRWSRQSSRSARERNG